jgi:hypothetical protein
MSHTMMEVIYKTEGVPWLSRDFTEKMCDHFALEYKDDHFYIESVEDFDLFYIKLKREYKDESMTGTFEEDYQIMRAYLEKQPKDGIEFCVGW